MTKSFFELVRQTVSDKTLYIGDTLKRKRVCFKEFKELEFEINKENGKIVYNKENRIKCGIKKTAVIPEYKHVYIFRSTHNRKNYKKPVVFDKKFYVGNNNYCSVPHLEKVMPGECKYEGKWRKISVCFILSYFELSKNRINEIEKKLADLEFWKYEIKWWMYKNKDLSRYWFTPILKEDIEKYDTDFGEHHNTVYLINYIEMAKKLHEDYIKKYQDYEKVLQGELKNKKINKKDMPKYLYLAQAVHSICEAKDYDEYIKDYDDVEDFVED